MIEKFEKSITDYIVKCYRINPYLFDRYTNVFSYPMYLKARDVIYILMIMAKEYNINLSLDMSDYQVISISAMSDYLNKNFDELLTT